MIGGVPHSWLLWYLQIQPSHTHTHTHTRAGVSILTLDDEFQTNLENQIVKIHTMWGSPLIKPFEACIKSWEERFVKMQDTIDEWLKVHGIM